MIILPVYTKHDHIGDGLCLGLPVKKNIRRFDHWYDAASSHLAAIRSCGESGSISNQAGWWFGTFFLFHFILMGCHPKPIDELHHFSEGLGKATNQQGSFPVLRLHTSSEMRWPDSTTTRCAQRYHRLWRPVIVCVGWWSHPMSCRSKLCSYFY